MDGTGSAFGLLEKPGSFGLDCGPDGLTLAGVPLLKRDARGFRPRLPEELHWLATSAYGRRLSEAEKVTGRILNLATPAGAMTSVQRTTIETVRKRAETLGVDLIVTPF